MRRYHQGFNHVSADDIRLARITKTWRGYGKEIFKQSRRAAGQYGTGTARGLGFAKFSYTRLIIVIYWVNKQEKEGLNA